MNETIALEFWLRGPVPQVPDLLQPVAHALLQARAEISISMNGFDKRLLWEKPFGLASPGFHLQHITGVLDRLLTYATGSQLSPEQARYLANEGMDLDETIDADTLVAAVQNGVEKAIAILKRTPESTLTESRGVGRAQLPSTVLGLLFHAAEHTMRHTGQLLVTVRVLSASGH